MSRVMQPPHGDQMPLIGDIMDPGLPISDLDISKLELNAEREPAHSPPPVITMKLIRHWMEKDPSRILATILGTQAKYLHLASKYQDLVKFIQTDRKDVKENDRATIKKANDEIKRLNKIISDTAFILKMNQEQNESLKAKLKSIQIGVKNVQKNDRATLEKANDEIISDNTSIREMNQEQEEIPKENLATKSAKSIQQEERSPSPETCRATDASETATHLIKTKQLPGSPHGTENEESDRDDGWILVKSKDMGNNKDAKQTDTTSEETWKALDPARLFCGTLSRCTAMNAFKKLRHTNNFHIFWHRFQTLASYLDFTDGQLFSELVDKLSPELRDLAFGAVKVEWHINLYQFAELCQKFA